MSDEARDLSKSSSEESDSNSTLAEASSTDSDSSSESNFDSSYNMKVYERRSMKEKKFERMEEMLSKLQKEEEELVRTIEEEKEALCEINRENVRKEELVRKLKRKLAHIQNQVPVPNAQCGATVEGDSRAAAEIFPEEIWLMILGKVTDPRTLWSCYNTCSVFRRILQPRKTTWEFEHALPYLFPHFSRKKLLECRLVSKGWKETVDQFLRNHPSYRPHNGDGGTHDPTTLPFVHPQEEKELFGFYVDYDHIPFSDGILLSFDDPEVLNKVRAKLSVGRVASVRFDCVRRPEYVDVKKVWEAVYNFFRTCGKLIWYLKLKFADQASDWAKSKIYRLLSEDLIELAPNLRSLRLGGGQGLRSANLDVDWTLLYPFLETLEVDDTYYHKAFLPSLEPLVRMHHAQLKKLCLADRFWSQVSCVEFPNLTELRLCYNGVSLDPLLERVRDGVVLPNLSKIGLEFYCNAKFGQFLQIVEEFSRTTRLSSLRLVQLGRGMRENVLHWSRSRLGPLCDFPRLTTVELEFRSGKTVLHPNLQFLLYFPHLENLHVFWSNDFVAEGEGRTALYAEDELDQSYDDELDDLHLEEMEEEEEEDEAEEDLEEVLEVNKYMYSGEIWDNIWDLLPRLKVFSFQWDVYHREGYEEYQRKLGGRGQGTK